jgi:hypothetical protein
MLRSGCFRRALKLSYETLAGLLHCAKNTIFQDSAREEGAACRDPFRKSIHVQLVLLGNFPLPTTTSPRPKATAAMADHSSVPFEIHSIILDFCGFPATRSYSLVAKATTSAAQRHLYRELHLGPAGHVTQWACTTIQDLLRTLVRRPDLVAVVKSVHLDVHDACNFTKEARYLE